MGAALKKKRLPLKPKKKILKVAEKAKRKKSTLIVGVDFATNEDNTVFSIMRVNEVDKQEGLPRDSKSRTPFDRGLPKNKLSVLGPDRFIEA